MAFTEAVEARTSTFSVDSGLSGFLSGWYRRANCIKHHKTLTVI